MISKTALGTFLKSNPFPRGRTDGLFYREKMRAIHRISPKTIQDDDRILEVGGGRSGMASFLFANAEIVTLDIDPLLAQYQPVLPRARFVCGDARQLPFPDAHFAIVTLFDVLEHIVEDHLAVQEALRVTKPGGYVLVTTPSSDWRYPYYSVMKRFCPPEAELMEEWGHVRRGYSLADLERLFGFVPERVASFINPVTAFYHDVAFSRLRYRSRLLLYAAAALPTAIAYGLHNSLMPGTEGAFAWRR